MTRSPRRLKAQVQETVSELPIHAARLAVMGVGQALLLTDRVRKDYREARESGIGPVLGRWRHDAEHLTVSLVGKVASRVTGESAPAKADGRRTRPAAESEIAVGKPGRPPAGRTRPSAGRTGPSASRSRAAAAPAGTTASSARREAAPPRTGAAKSTPVAGTERAGATQRPTAARPRTAGAKPTAKPSTAKPSASKPTAAKPTAAKPTPAKPSAAKPSAGTTAAEGKPATPRSGAETTAAGRLPVQDYDQASLASVRARLRNLTAQQVTRLRDYERANAARAEFLRMYENRLNKLREQG